MRTRSEAVAIRAAATSRALAAANEVRQVSTPEVPHEVVVRHDAVTEQVVIAAEVVGGEEGNRLLDRILPDTFLVPQHRGIQVVLAEMRRRRLDYGPDTLLLLGLSQADVDYVEQLAALRPTIPANLDLHVDRLYWDKERHTFATGVLPALIAAVADPLESPERVVALARALPDALGSYRKVSHVHDPAQLVRDQVDEIRKRKGGQAHRPLGVPGLDFYEEVPGEPPKPRLIPGAAPKRTIVVVGTSGSGKSTLCSHIALGLRKQGRRGFVGAWEQNGGTSLEMMAEIDLGLSREDMQLGIFTDDQLGALEARMAEIAKDVTFQSNPWHRKGKRAPKDRADPNGANMDVLQACLADSGAEWVILDLWRRMLRDFSPDEEEQALVRQQAMAEELNISQVLVQQIRSKDLEARGDKRPTRESIKGSGAWIEVPDLILATNRPALWKRIDDTTMEVFVLKQRYGKWPLGVELEWNAEFGSLGKGKSIPYDVEQGEGSGNEIDSIMRTPQHGGKKWSRGRKVEK